MADSLPVSQEPVSQGPVSQEPAGGFSFKQMLPTLVFDVAMPIVAFNVLTGYGVSAPGPSHAGSNRSASS